MPDFPPLSPVPLCYLTQKGDLVTATATCEPATLALGTPGEVLAVAGTPTGLTWTPPYEYSGFLSCSTFTKKGDLMVNVAFTGDAAVALPVGSQGQILASDSDSPFKMSWQDAPITYTGLGQLLVGDKNKDYATVQGCQGAILQYQLSNPIRWTATCGTQVFTKQEGFQKGTLAIGISPDQGSQFVIGPDNSVLTVCSTNAFGVQWKPLVPPTPTNANARVCHFAGSDPAPFYCELLPASAFSEGCTVFTEVTGDWYLNGTPFAHGRFQLCQGGNGSYLIPYGAPDLGMAGSQPNVCRPQYNLSYIFNSWDSNCGLCMVVYFDADVGNPNQRYADFRAVTTAFAL